MNLSTNRNPPKRIRYSYSSVFPYKQKIYDTNAKKLNKSNTKIKKGIKRYISPSAKYSKQRLNNFIIFSLINWFRQNTSHIRNNSSLNYIIISNKNNSGIYNSYIVNPAYKNANLTKINSNVQILPTKYLQPKLSKFNILNYNEKCIMNKAPTNLGYNRYKIILTESLIQPVQNIIMNNSKNSKKRIFYIN